MAEFGALNWAIVVAYIIGNLLLGFALSKRVETADHFFLGRRTTPWWAIGISVIATYVGVLAFMGGPAWAYKEGFSVIFIHINYPIAIAITVTLFLPFFYASGTASIFDYLERRFGLKSRALMSGIFLFGNIAYSGITLYTTALVLEFITGMDVVTAILIVGVVAFTYTALGGIVAVIWTDVIQSAILFIGAFIILFMLIDALPDGLSAALAGLKATGKTNPFEYSPDPARVATVWSGVIAMSVYHVVVYGVNQMMVQRTLAAKSIGDAKKAYIMMGYAAFPVYVLFFGIGLLFYSYYNGRVFDNDNLIMLEFVAAIGAPGLMGIVTAAIIAAAMSSLDSSLNSMATVTTLDFYQKFVRREGTPRHYLTASRWFMLMWAVIIIVPAILFTGSDGSVLEILSKIGSFFVGAKLAMFGLGFFSRHTSERGLIIGVVAGFLFLAWLEYYQDIAWPWYCPLGGLVSAGVAWVASVLLDGFQSEYSAYSVKGQQAAWKAGKRPLKQDGWHAVSGKIDKPSYWLLGYFAACVAALWLFEAWL